MRDGALPPPPKMSPGLLCREAAACVPLTPHTPRRPPWRQRRSRPRAAADEVGAWLEEHAGAGTVVRCTPLGGSDWARCSRYDMSRDGASFFVKQSSRGPEMFQGEAWGLRAMGAARALHVPAVLHAGALPNGSFIAMEHLDLGGAVDQAVLGTQLALMHAAEPLCEPARDGRFGFPVENTIGGTPQRNSWSELSGTAGWVAFFAEQRLRPQCALTREATLIKLGDRLCDRLPALFEGLPDEVRPAILHGDLWSGNIAATGGQPVVFDPASYYGHDEADFGMSWCASFGPAFWSAYHDVIPRAPGFERRAKLYQLYHYVNHYNLFGGAYYSSALRLLQELTA